MKIIRPLNIAIFPLAVVCCALVSLLLVPVPAVGFDWLDKGKELFRGGMETKSPTTLPLTENDIASGLKEALRVSADRVVAQLGVVDGFMTDPQIHIPLPEKLEMARSGLNAIGQSALLENLELKLNRAAENATPQAKELFWSAIEEMTLERARTIYNGPEDGATQYFKEKMSEPLRAEMAPIVSNSMAEVGAVQAYEAALGQYKMLPFVPDIQGDLTEYVVNKGLDGIFFYLAKEEAAIRQNPVKRTTELLQKVFSSR